MAIDQSEARRQGPDEQQQTIIFYILSAKITPGALLLNEPLMVSQHEIRHKQSLIISFPQLTSLCVLFHVNCEMLRGYIGTYITKPLVPFSKNMQNIISYVCEASLIVYE